MVTVARQRRSTVFGKRLRELREAANLTQTELGLRAGLLYQTVAKYERGAIEPTWPNVIVLARALGVPTDAFLGDDEQGDLDDDPERDEGKRK